MMYGLGSLYYGVAAMLDTSIMGGGGSSPGGHGPGRAYNEALTMLEIDYFRRFGQI